MEHTHEEMDVQQIELIDDEGNVSAFIIDEWFDYNESIYAILITEENDEDALLFRVEEQGEETQFITPEEEEFNEVSRYYEELEE